MNASKPFAAALSFAAAMFVLAPAASAATSTVCDSGCDHDNVQDAIDAAGYGDVLSLGAGTYSGPLTVGPGQYVVLDGNGVAELDADSAASALTVLPGGAALLRDIDVTGTAQLAAILNQGTLTLEGVTVSDCVAALGAVFNYAVLVVADHSVFSNNESTQYRAGAINNIGTADILDATFLNNEGHNGGAVSNLAGDMFIGDSSFTGNSAYLGGAVHNSFADLTIEDSSFSSNFATTIGGAWSNHNCGGTVTTSGVGYAANTTGSGSYVDAYDVSGC